MRLVLFNHADPRPVECESDSARFRVGGSAFDYDYLDIGEGLREDRVNRLADKSAVVEAGNDNGH